MDLDVINEWTKLILRWVHVFAGIMWVGTTYFFTWLDGRFVELEQKAEAAKSVTKIEKEIWMVHSGGFYRVEKQKIPNVMPEKLHWFRWEAAITWLSGVLLLIMVYFQGGLMINFEDSPIRAGTAIWLSVALLVAVWPIYDLLWFKVIKNDALGVIISFLLVVALAWFLTRVLSGRAAYMQLGGMF